jgi:hypothetical protein
MSTIESLSIADCTWSVRDEAGAWHPIQILLMKPIKEEVDWSCTVQIFWPQSDPRFKKAYGVDSLQALEMGLALLRAEENLLTKNLGDQFRAEPPSR